MTTLINNWKIVLILCLTLGLAPFFPEPHIVGKIQWISGGANGMQMMDWLDVLLHGFPWILLLIIGIAKLTRPTQAKTERDQA